MSITIASVLALACVLAFQPQWPTDLGSGRLYLPALVNDGTAILPLVSPMSASFSPSARFMQLVLRVEF